MNAVWLENGVLSLLRNVPEPVLQPGEALVRILLAGICNTDLELVKGYYSFTGIPGHEFVGRIETAPGCPEREGERVVGSINAVCHQCDMCLRGLPGHCRERTVLGIAGRNGVFAEYTTLPLDNLVAVPEHVPDIGAVFTEPLAASLQITEHVEIKKGNRVIVVGAGKLGQLISEVFLIQGHNTEAIPKYLKQRKRMEELGIVCRSASECSRSFYDLVIEATGSPEGLNIALGLVRPGGTLVLKSTYHGEVSLDFSRVVVDEITILGSRCGPVPKALGLLAEGLINPKSGVEGIFSLEQGLEAFETASRKGAGKILLRI